MTKLSHYDDEGRISMVDVGQKDISVRRAVAAAKVLLNDATLDAIRQKHTPKGDPLEIARIAGIIAAKRTSELIPLCHQIALSKANVTVEIVEDGIELTAEAVTSSQTGVEMEALTAVSVAALTIYDMLKAVQRDIAITDIRLIEKTGGKSDYRAG
ncbi:MAG TPA: cyclic pyranopterin monophosphate synthase MoaC [Pyrinomonadaceae bacterium]|nr:cyclic pyranopterin monophosphate synthase MoaC [Pyrinomonadaceae bacterium]